MEFLESTINSVTSLSNLYTGLTESYSHNYRICVHKKLPHHRLLAFDLYLFSEISKRRFVASVLAIRFQQWPYVRR